MTDRKNGEKAEAAHVDGLHAAVLGSDFGLLDGQQVGSRHRDHCAATVETHTHTQRHRRMVRLEAPGDWLVDQDWRGVQYLRMVQLGSTPLMVGSSL